MVLIIRDEVNRYTEYKNGTVWLDAAGSPIQAHGGCIINYKDYYYWYGENRLGDNYISCYRSDDLLNWEFRNNILTINSKTEKTRVKSDMTILRDDGRKVIIERPKVVYNKFTNKFVMWAHYENGINYSEARCCVATCDTPDGDFVYHGSFNPFGNMSRDCTLFEDENGDMYFISSARFNCDTNIYRLQKDYLNIDKYITTLWQGEVREAPAMFKKDGTYYMLNSGCTGWRPNQGMWSQSSDVSDRWDILKNVGDCTTYNSQPAFILKTEEEGKIKYRYFGDRWVYKEKGMLDGQEDIKSFYSKSTYVILDIKFDEDGNLSIDWQDEFRPKVK